MLTTILYGDGTSSDSPRSPQTLLASSGSSGTQNVGDDQSNWEETEVSPC